jgi:hypothetical protein
MFTQCVNHIIQRLSRHFLPTKTKRARLQQPISSTVLGLLPPSQANPGVSFNRIKHAQLRHSSLRNCFLRLANAPFLWRTA